MKTYVKSVHPPPSPFPPSGGEIRLKVFRHLVLEGGRDGRVVRQFDVDALHIRKIIPDAARVQRPRLGREGRHDARSLLVLQIIA